MALNGIDISNHQKGLNLKDITCDFVICKATEGTTFVDKYCDGFMQQAMKLGKKVGVYHFASGKTTGKAEADFFLKNVQGYIGKAILILDWEAGAVAKGPAYAKEFLDRVLEKTGIKPMIGQRSKMQTMAFGMRVTTMDIQKWDTLRKHL